MVHVQNGGSTGTVYNYAHIIITLHTHNRQVHEYTRVDIKLT